MQKFSGMLVMLAIVGLGVSIVSAETITYTYEEQWLSDTPTKYGPKGLYTIYSPETNQKGKFGVGFYWDMTRFCLPGDPRYPRVMEFTLGGAYGITDKLEVSLAAPFRNVNIPGAPSETRDPNDIGLDDVTESGFSNLSLGVRYNLTEWLTPYVQAFLPTASDPEKGIGADNTRIHVGLSTGTVVEGMRNTRLYGQVAYQFATGYDQDRRDFSEVNRAYPRPRFERYGTNPLYQEYGATLFYGTGMAMPIVENAVELFSEFNFYHSFEDKDYIPMYRDGEELDVVQDGGMANVGLRAGFGNGLALTAGWGGVLFAKEPMYESPTWKLFAGLTYAQPHEVRRDIIVPDIPPEEGQTQLPGPGDVFTPPPFDGGGVFDCNQVLVLAHYEFDKSTLTPEAIEALQWIGYYMRLCTETVLEVQGHTDWMGTENYNIGLGNRRARAAVYYLVYDEGIDPARIVSSEKLARGIIAGETYGESVPMASNETDAGRALNRRAQFVKLVEDTRVLRQRQ